MDLPSLPFTIPNVYEGLATAKGLARMTAAGLTLEFEVKDGFVGVIKSGVREVHIANDDLHQLDLRAGWFSTRLFIRARSMAVLSRLPGSEAGAIELRVARHDRATARALVSTMMLRLSERDLERLASRP